MKKIFVLLFTSLLMASMFISCGGGSSGGDDTTKKNIPGSSTQVDTKAKKSSSGCQTNNIPGCSK